jgi:arylformamidase
VLIDLTHRIEDGMPVFPGDPVVAVASAASEPPWKLTTLRLGSHSGTHVDAASHLIDGGRTIDAYPLERFVLDAVVVHLDAAPLARLEWDDLADQLPSELRGVGVLLHTGWEREWDGEAMGQHPYLTAAAARSLVDAGVTLVGTDALNVDCTDEPTTDAHAALLGADVLIVENLTNLAALEAGRRHRCAFIPLRLGGADGSPVRAFAWS